jgi:hypothetical protein
MIDSPEPPHPPRSLPSGSPKARPGGGDLSPSGRGEAKCSLIVIQPNRIMLQCRNARTLNCMAVERGTSLTSAATSGSR